MMTIHSAKGLEFPYVFVCGLTEGIFPSRRACTERQLEEERRLAYVAFTRAKNMLFLSDAEGLDMGGQHRYPSRFIFDAGKENIEYIEELNDDLIDETRIISEQSEKKFNFTFEHSVGDRVSHEFFGTGIVNEVDIDRMVYLVKFDNITTPRSIGYQIELIAV
jgi:DNA helicase-2/ATP-dependent DNA helicase PcrA